MHAAASGMDAYIFNLDVIANNMANAGTTAFKRSRSTFEDLYYQYYKLPGQPDALGNKTPIGKASGLGVRVSGTQPEFTQGSLVQTNRQLDVAIVGDGFLQVNDGTQVLYTRNGALSLNPNGDLVIASADKGRLLDPPINVPPDTLAIGISGDGIVTVLQPSSSVPTQVGTIQLVKFVNPEGLIHKGDTLYSSSDASGLPLPATPGSQGLGTLKQSYLELSNAEPVTELVELIKTQRNVELNSQVLQASDQLLQLVSNLRRY